MLYVGTRDPAWAIFVYDITKYPEPATHFSHGYAQMTWRWVRHPHMPGGSDLDQIRTSQYALNERFTYYADEYVIEEMP
jgi:hypothetical protein